MIPTSLESIHMKPLAAAGPHSQRIQAAAGTSGPDAKLTDNAAQLRRRLNLPLLVLYGVGVTIGAGIYVLIGSVAGHAGVYAPWAFVLAAIVMGLTVASYAELCTHFPVAAGEAAYVRAAFRSRVLSTMTGMVMIISGVIASATVAIGATGYIAQFVSLPQPMMLTAIVIIIGLVTAWGVLESVLLAALFTVIEIAGLLAIIAAAAYSGLPIGTTLTAVPPFELNVWAGIAFASLLAFFAFIGFEDLTNMVEESHSPERNVPLAMAFTLVITTVLYVLIAAIAVTAVPVERLTASAAPLSLVYQEVAGLNPAIISVIAIVATLNTIIAQTTMATRVVYGMARQGDLPRVLGKVSSRTATPLWATAAIVVAVLGLALVAPLERLAEWASLSTLAVFALVNLSLLWLRWRGIDTRRGEISIPVWVPLLGFVCCIGMLASAAV